MELNGNSNGNGADQNGVRSLTVRHGPTDPGPGGPGGEQNGFAQLRQILDALRRRWLLILFLGLVFGGGAAAGVWYVMPTPYTATAHLRVNPNTRFFYSPREGAEDTIRYDQYRDNLIYNAKTEWMIMAALNRDDAADAGAAPPTQPAGANDAARRPDSGDTEKPSDIGAAAQKASSDSPGETDAGKNESAQDPAADPDAAPVVATNKPVPAPKKTNRSLKDCPTLRDIEFPASWIERQLSVGRSGNEYIRISMTGEHPQDLRDIVNAVANSLMVEVVDKDAQQRRESLETLIVITKEEADRLAIKERQLAEQDAKIAVLGSDADAQKLADDRALRLQIRQDLGQLKLQIIQYDVQRRVLRGMPATTDSETQVAGESAIDDDVFDVLFADDLEFRGLLSSAKRKESELAMSRLRFSPDNAAGKKAIDEAESNHALAADRLTKYRAEHQAAARERMRQMGSTVTAGTDPAVLDQQIALMEATRDELQKELADSESAEKDITNYLIDRRKFADEVAALKLRVKEKEDAIYARRTELENQQDPVELIAAQTPTQPDTAKQIKMAGAAGFGLFGLIGGAIVWLEILTKRVSHVTDVEQQLHLQVIGSVPSMPRFAMKASNNGEKRAKAAYWHSVLTESIDSARTMLLRYAKTGRLKTVMIASATGGEGKTSVSCHLATSLARAGRRVLLMDCDIRRPSVNWVFGLENDTGFCELLCGLGTPDEAIQEAAVPGLYVLPAGHVNSDVLRNLAQENLGELLESVSKDFDFVIIDTSPILPVTDALMFAQHVDGILFSIRRDVSRMAKVQTAVQRLAMLGAPLLGAVAIGLDEGIYGTRYHYHYRYNGYGYGHHPSYNGGNGELTTEVIEQGSA